MELLGVNCNPLAKTYSYHAFMGAIIDSKDVLRVKINNNKKCQWNIITYDTSVHMYNDLIVVEENDDCNNREGFIYRKCKNKDEIVIKVEKMDVTNEHPILNLFMSGNNPQECADKNKDIFRFGIYKYGVMVSYEGAVHKDISVDFSEIDWFKLYYKNNTVCASISCDGQRWDEIYNSHIDICREDVLIGLNYNNIGSGESNNLYKTWVYMNYTQLYYSLNSNDNICLDYNMFPIKNYHYESVYAHQFLDIQYIDMQEIFDVHRNLQSFIEISLRHKYYVSVCIDEYYIPGRKAYHNYHFHHYNLIYGYDAENNIFYALGYDDKFIPCKISGKVISKAIFEHRSEIIRYKKRFNKVNMHFDIKLYCTKLQEYIDGINSDENYSNLLAQEKGVYGLNVFDELINTERGRQLFLIDIRISYLLYEHASIMKERLQYFLDNRYLFCEDKSVKELLEKCENIVKQSRALNLLIIKNNVKEMDTTIIFAQLEQLYMSEKEFYIDLLNGLMEKHDDK